ncbi:MAG TPA: fibronectin type III domain-containing protein, partial [Tepidisphaeraceae bacterium]|nr:fibronectin type III domain-containing protein [Tepidisphaeraceae bacterium]
MSESRKNKSIKRSRVAAAQIMRSAAEATVEPLEQRQLLSSVGINFTGGYNSGSANVPPWSVGTTTNAGIRTGTAVAAGTTSHTIAGVQQNWNDANGGAGSMGSLLDSTGANSGATVTWSSGGTWASAVNQPAQGDERLNTGFLNSGGTATPINITVSNVPYAQYDVVVYMLNDAAGRVQTTTLNGYSLYGSSPNPNTNAYAPQYLIDSNGATAYYYAQGTSSNPSSPSSNIDFEVFSMQGTGTAGSSFVLSDVSPGNGYINGIQIVDDENGLTNMQPFAPVENATVSTVNSVILNWQSVMGNVTYTVLRAPVSGGTPTSIGTTSAGTTTFTDTTAAIGTTYNYWITATSPLQVVSAQSNVQQGHVDPNAPPPAPTNLTAVADPNSSTITLNWNASPNTTGYVIQRSTDFGATWQTINPNGDQWDFLGNSNTSYVDSNVTGGPAYLYRVGSINDAGNSKDLTNSDGTGVVAFSNTAGDGWNIQGTGDGLSGYYFNSITNGSENQTPFTGTPFGATVNPGGIFFSRVDGAVDYTGANSDSTPPPNSPADWKSISNVGDNFSVDWV